MISICTLAGISCILQNYFGGWDFWVPPVVFAGMAGLWVLHFSNKLDPKARIIVYFIYAAFLLFYHGIHDTSLFDISVSVALFMVTFTMADRIGLLNIILAEYIVVMAIQFWFLYIGGRTDMSAFEIMRMVYHIVTVLTMYVFSRITVDRRIIEKEQNKEWMNTVLKNDRDMEDFLSNISHELRTPVNVISGMTTILQKGGSSEELDSIQSAGIRLAHQIEDIQDYTEIKRGELHIDYENYMCISLMNDVSENYKQINKNKDLELVLDLAPETPTMLRGDIEKLHKLFRHLIENAVKFTKHGGVYVRVFPVFQKYGINLTIEVTDTGIGMTRADMSLVSKGMYQANKKRDRSTGGIGIGLPIVYGIVHKMGGFVNISSTVGKGTTVRLSIPQQVIDPTYCLKANEGSVENLVFFTKLEKFTVPRVRDFYRNMAANMARGLGLNLYSISDAGELERVLSETGSKYVFMGKEEYEADKRIIEDLSRKGFRIIISSNDQTDTKGSKGITVIPKPLYAFPVVRMINGEDIAPELDDSGKKPYFTGVKVLIVDDEVMNLVVASGLLRDYGFDIDTAESGMEAVNKYENGDYDVIFMDHMMPEMDGVETAKRIRHIADSSFRSPLIIALTANALSGAREMFMREGFDGFIAKPININEFERVMKSILPEEMISYEGRDEQ